MFCAHCGTDLPEGKYCPSCGKQQGSAATPPPPPVYVPPPSYPLPIYHMPLQQHPYKRVGGMLTFLMVLMILAIASTPLVLLMDFINFRGIVLVIELISTVFIALPIVYMAQLLKRDHKFLLNFHIIAGASIVWTVIRQVIALFQADAWTNEMMPFVDPTVEFLIQGFSIFLIFFTIVIQVMWFILWRIYFTRSVRVRTFMGSDQYMTECLFTRKITPPQPAVPDEQAPPPFD